MAGDLMRQLNKWARPFRTRIAMLLSRGVGHMSKSTTPHQQLQVELQPGEIHDRVEHYESYGMTANPPAGFEPVAVSFGGERARTIVIVAAHRGHRKKGLAPGEVALYTDEGDYILLKRGRIVEVVAGTKLKVTAPTVEIVGNATISGTLTVEGAILSNTSVADSAGTMSEMRGYYNGHSHPGGVVTPQMT